MQLGYELVKEQRFFRKELIERAYWFIQLRWVAVGAALLGVWTASFFCVKLPVDILTVIILAIFVYNIVFFLFCRRLKSSKPDEVRSYAIFTHVQIVLDLAALYLFIYFTGGLYSPILLFVIFHIILAGILLSPTACFTYSIISLVILGILVTLEQSSILTARPVFFERPLTSSGATLQSELIIYITFAAAILITAFLITSVKLSLRTKGRALLGASRELDANNAKLTALYEMVKHINLCSSLKELMDSAVRNAAIIMGVKGCSIKLLDDQKKRLKFASAYGLSEDYIAKETIDIERSPINRKIIQGSFFSIGKIDERDYFQYPEDIRKEGIASMVCLPLRVEKIVLGVFCVYSGKSYYFDDSDVKFFSLMADLTALAIENLQNELKKTWFLKKAAHQLRSPFNAVYSMLKVLNKEYLGPLNQEQTNNINRCIKRIEILGYLINDLLDSEIKRSDIGKTIIQPVDGTKIINNLVSLYHAQAREKGIDIEFSVEKKLPELMADERLIDQLFNNLISNALKYTKTGGKVHVTLAPESNHRVRFEVSDTGIGIDDKDLPHLFSEFFRTDNAKTHVEEGSGLGLVIVKDILDRIRGSISVESRIGEGTRFTCLLPSV